MKHRLSKQLLAYYLFVPVHLYEWCSGYKAAKTIHIQTSGLSHYCHRMVVGIGNCVFCLNSDGGMTIENVATYTICILRFLQMPCFSAWLLRNRVSHCIVSFVRPFSCFDLTIGLQKFNRISINIVYSPITDCFCCILYVCCVVCLRAHELLFWSSFMMIV